MNEIQKKQCRKELLERKEKRKKGILKMDNIDNHYINTMLIRTGCHYFHDENDNLHPKLMGVYQEVVCEIEEYMINLIIDEPTDKCMAEMLQKVFKNILLRFIASIKWGERKDGLKLLSNYIDIMAMLYRDGFRESFYYIIHEIFLGGYFVYPPKTEEIEV